MSTDTLIRKALDAGVELGFVDGELKVIGKRSAVAAWVPRLRPHKAALIVRIQENSLLTVKLLQAAMRVCDHHGDNQAARDQMQHDVQSTPPHLQADLLEHFQAAYPKDNTP